MRRIGPHRSLTRADRRHFDGPAPKPDPRFQQVGGDGFETDDEIEVAATLEQAAFREGNAMVRDV